MHTDLIFISPETMRLLGDLHRNEQILLIATGKDKKQLFKLGFLWPNAFVANNQISIHKSLIDQLSDQQTIELKSIPKENIQDATNISLKYFTKISFLRFYSENDIFFYSVQLIRMNLGVPMNVV